MANHFFSEETQDYRGSLPWRTTAGWQINGDDCSKAFRFQHELVRHLYAIQLPLIRIPTTRYYNSESAKSKKQPGPRRQHTWKRTTAVSPLPIHHQNAKSEKHSKGIYASLIVSSLVPIAGGGERGVQGVLVKCLNTKYQLPSRLNNSERPLVSSNAELAKKRRRGIY